MKKRMIIATSHMGINVTYRCYKLPDYGRRCPDRDDGYHCMACKYSKAEMSGFYATRLLSKYGGNDESP